VSQKGRQSCESAAAKRSMIILTTIEGTPWTSAGFRTSWRKACDKAGIKGVTFNDLRGTAVTRLAIAECTETEIATITGHSLRDVRSILDAHYLRRRHGYGRGLAVEQSTIEDKLCNCSHRVPLLHSSRTAR